MAPIGSVLVVDDDPLLRAIASEALTQAGMAVFVAADGTAAVRHLAIQIPDLIVLDMLMPLMDGVETLREIKSRHPSMPVIAISGGTARRGGADLLLRTATVMGADATMTKPLDLAELGRLAIELIRRPRPSAALDRGAAS